MYEFMNSIVDLIAFMISMPVLASVNTIDLTRHENYYTCFHINNNIVKYKDIFPNLCFMICSVCIKFFDL